MAELSDRLAEFQARLTTQAEAQIQQWHAERTALLDRAISRFEHVGIDITHHWQGVGQPLHEVRIQKDLDGIQADLAQALAMTTEDREWRDVEQTPEYQAWERERNIPIHEPDPAELGRQAEQRFYAEQDPESPWYREDLYHGEPGPDVAIDLAEEELLQRERELVFAGAQLIMAAQEPSDPAIAGIARQERSLMQGAPIDPEGLYGWNLPVPEPEERLVIDTSAGDTGGCWEAQLAAIEARLDALAQAVEAPDRTHEQGMGY